MKSSYSHIDGVVSHSKIAVFTVGRFNPPTKGHEKLFRKTHDLAAEYGGDAYIFPSSTQGTRKNKSNPLPIDIKVSFIKELMSWANIVNVSAVNNAWDALSYLVECGYTTIYLVAGSDRTKEYENRWLPHAQKSVQTAGVISAGLRDPDGQGISAMSGTKAQEAAKRLDLFAFATATGWPVEASQRLMEAVYQGLQPGVTQDGNTRYKNKRKPIQDKATKLCT